eukprot:g10211.t1
MNMMDSKESTHARERGRDGRKGEGEDEEIKPSQHRDPPARRIWALTGWGLKTRSTYATVSHWIHHYRDVLQLDPRFFVVLLFAEERKAAEKFGEEELCAKHGTTKILGDEGWNNNKEPMKHVRASGITNHLFADFEPYSVNKMVYDRFYLLKEVGVTSRDWVLQADGDELAMFPGMRLPRSTLTFSQQEPASPVDPAEVPMSEQVVSYPLTELVDDLEENGENAMFALLAERVGPNGELENEVLELDQKPSTSATTDRSIWQQFPLNCALQLLTMEADPVKVILYRGHLRSAGHDIFARVFAGGFPNAGHLPALWQQMLNMDKGSENYKPWMPAAQWEFDFSMSTARTSEDDLQEKLPVGVAAASEVSPTTSTSAGGNTEAASRSTSPAQRQSADRGKSVPLQPEDTSVNTTAVKPTYIVFPELQWPGAHNLLVPRVNAATRIRDADVEKLAKTGGKTTAFPVPPPQGDEAKHSFEWKRFWPVFRHARNIMQENTYVESGGSEQDYLRMLEFLGKETMDLVPRPDHMREVWVDDLEHDKTIPLWMRHLIDDNEDNPFPLPADHYNRHSKVYFLRPNPTIVTLYHFKWTQGVAQKHANLAVSDDLYKDFVKQGGLPLEFGLGGPHEREGATTTPTSGGGNAGGRSGTSGGDDHVAAIKSNDIGVRATDSNAQRLSAGELEDYCLPLNSEATPGRFSVAEKVAFFAESRHGPAMTGPFDSVEAVALIDVYLLRLFVFGWARRMTAWQKSEGGAW